MFDAPVIVSVIVAGDRARSPASPPTDTTLIDRLADPLPDAGLTCSHGWFDAAVHVTVRRVPGLRQPHDLRRRLRRRTPRPFVSRREPQRRLVERQLSGGRGLIVSVYGLRAGAAARDVSRGHGERERPRSASACPRARRRLDSVTPVGSVLDVLKLTRPRASDVVNVVVYATPAVPGESKRYASPASGRRCSPCRIDSTIEPDPFPKTRARSSRARGRRNSDPTLRSGSGQPPLGRHPRPGARRQAYDTPSPEKSNVTSIDFRSCAAARPGNSRVEAAVSRRRASGSSGTSRQGLWTAAWALESRAIR